MGCRSSLALEPRADRVPLNVRPPFVAVLALAAALVAGCKRPGPAPPVALSDAGTEAARVVRFRATDSPQSCVFEQGGPFLDFGETAERWRLRDAAGIEEAEREGASWWPIDARTVRAVVAIDAQELTADSFWTVDLRVLASESRNLMVFVNDRVVGSVRVDPGPPKIETLRVDRSILTAGDNTIALAARRASGARIGAGQVLVDWVRLHHDGPGEGHASRPSRRSVNRIVARGGTSYKAFSLPDGTSLACTMPLSAHATTTAALAVEGSGEVEAELRWKVADRELPPLARVVLRGSEPSWSRVDGGAPLIASTTMATLEVRVIRATQGSRLLVADLGWSVPAEPAREIPPAVEGALVVLLSHVGMSDLATLRSALELAGTPAVASVFRSGSLSGNAAVASLLSGLRAEAIAVLDADARVPPSALTLPRALKAAGVQTFYGSGHPLSGAAHGFLVPDWDRALAHPPTDSAAAPIEDFTRWLEEAKPKRFFGLLHLRGGHAPFDLRPAEAQLLAPTGYTGTVDPAQVASWWSRHPRGPLRLTEADRTRLDALHDASLAKQTALLGKAIAELRRSYPKAVVILTTDVGFRPHDPQAYDEGVLLAHDALVGPLVSIGLPRVTAEPVSLRDVHATLADLFDVTKLSRGSGVPLWADGREAIATVRSGRSRALWVGDLVFESADGVDTRLCAWANDPECRGTEAAVPASLRDGFRRLEGELTQQPVALRREPVTVDGPLEKALRLWGL